jgi:hypothetical protein
MTHAGIVRKSDETRGAAPNGAFPFARFGLAALVFCHKQLNPTLVEV